jgi:hypothetical protein
MDEFFHGYLQARAKTLNRRGAHNGETATLHPAFSVVGPVPDS